MRHQGKMEQSQTYWQTEPKNILSTMNATLLQTSQYSDLTVRCGGNEHHLHRAIICPRSNFFAACCNGRFKVNLEAALQVHQMLIYTKEGKEMIIDLPEDDPATFAKMVEYLYTLDYDDQITSGE